MLDYKWLRLLFSYFNDLDPLTIRQDEIILYINYLKSGLNLGRAWGAWYLWINEKAMIEKIMGKERYVWLWKLCR